MFFGWKPTIEREWHFEGVATDHQEEIGWSSGAAGSEKEGPFEKALSLITRVEFNRSLINKLANSLIWY